MSKKYRKVRWDEDDVFSAWKCLNQNARLVKYFQEAFNENVYFDLVWNWLEDTCDEETDDDYENLVQYYIEHYVEESEREEKWQLWQKYQKRHFKYC